MIFFVRHKAVHWYIKKGDRTLGPVEVGFIEKCLLTRELVFTDYVSENGKPWKMIRDVKVFAQTLRDLENPKASGIPFLPSEDTLSQLKLSHKTILDEEVAGESESVPLAVESFNKSEFQLSGWTPEIKRSSNTRTSQARRPRDFRNPSLKKKFQRRSKKINLLWRSLGALVVFALGFFLTKYFYEK